MNIIAALRTLFQTEEAMAAHYRELARVFTDESLLAPAALEIL